MSKEAGRAESWTLPRCPLQAEDHVPGHAPQGRVGGGQAPGEMTVPVDEHLALPALDAVEVVVRGDVIGRRVGVPAEGSVAGVVAARPDVRGRSHGVEGYCFLLLDDADSLEFLEPYIWLWKR